MKAVNGKGKEESNKAKSMVHKFIDRLIFSSMFSISEIARNFLLL